LLEAVRQHEFTLPTFHPKFQLTDGTDHRRYPPKVLHAEHETNLTVQIFSIGQFVAVLPR